MQCKKSSLMLCGLKTSAHLLKAHCSKRRPTAPYGKKACPVSGIGYPHRHFALGVLHSVGEGDEFAQDGENSKGDANI